MDVTKNNTIHEMTVYIVILNGHISTKKVSGTIKSVFKRATALAWRSYQIIIIVLNNYFISIREIQCTDKCSITLVEHHFGISCITDEYNARISSCPN